MTTIDDLMTIPEAAQRFGVRYDSVRHHIRAGHLPARKVGGRWFITKEAYQRWANDASLHTRGPKRRKSKP